MTTAKIFQNGRSQAVRLPKEFRFADDEEVIIKRLGEAVVLIPKSKLKDLFLSSLKSFPEDFQVDRREAGARDIGL